MKVLFLVPGNPSATTSGLGIAVEKITLSLKTKIELIAFSPDDYYNKKSPLPEESNILATIDEQLTEELIHSQITHKIPHYIDSYFTGDEKQIIEQKSKIKSLVKEYTNDVIESSESLDFNLVYAHDWINIQAALILHERYQKPFVLHIHSLDYDRSSKSSNSWVYQLEKQGLDKATEIIAVSKYHKQIMIDHYGIDKNKITVVHLAVDVPNKIVKKNKFDEKLIVFIGRLAEQKSPQKFLEIAKRVYKKNKNTRFVLAGAGDLLEPLIDTGIYDQLEGKIHFTGHVNQKKLQELYSMADIFCMPSVSEPFGLSAIEAAAFGLPVVISKQAGANEILSKTFTSDHLNTQKFATHILKLIDTGYSLSDAELNRKTLSNRKWSDVGNEIIQVFDKVISS